jgi:hypothetical protein
VCATVRDGASVSAGNAGFTHSRAQSWTLATGCDGDGIQEVEGSTPFGSIEFRGVTVLGCEAVATIATTSPVSAP